MDEPSLEHLQKLLVLSLGGALAAMMVAAWAAGIGLDPASFLPLICMCLVVGFFWPYTAWRKLTRLQTAIEAFAGSLLMSIPVLGFTYAAMRLGLPLQDGALAAADAAIGFNSRDFTLWVDQYPLLARFLGTSYASFGLQLIFLPALLCVLGLPARGYALIVSLVFLGIVCSAITVFFPAEAAFAHFGIGAGDLKNINHELGYSFRYSFDAVRADPEFTLSAATASGIVTFPSGHAGAAVLCAWAAWGSRLLRLPLVAINAGMFVAAITHGAHYLVDLLAGGLIAAAAAWFTSWLIQGAPALRRPKLKRRAAPAALA